jgi:hypothetical protein
MGRNSEAMMLGGELYFRTLVEYLTHFAGRFAVPVTAFGPAGAGWDSGRSARASGCSPNLATRFRSP